MTPNDDRRGYVPMVFSAQMIRNRSQQAELELAIERRREMEEALTHARLFQESQKLSEEPSRKRRQSSIDAPRQQLDEEPSQKRSRSSADAPLVQGFASGQTERNTEESTPCVDPPDRFAIFHGPDSVEPSISSSSLDRDEDPLNEDRFMADTQSGAFEFPNLWIEEDTDSQAPSADPASRPRSLSDDIDSFLACMRHP